MCISEVVVGLSKGTRNYESSGFSVGTQTQTINSPNTLSSKAQNYKTENVPSQPTPSILGPHRNPGIAPI